MAHKVEVLSGSKAVFPELLKTISTLGMPRAILACTFAFQEEVFGAILQNLCAELDIEYSDLRKIPIDVICDKKMYRGHPAGYNVIFWPDQSRLFHPKILLFLFEDQVVWVDGSINLTVQAWQENREIAMIHAPGCLALPSELRELLEKVTGLSPAAEAILSVVRNNEPADAFPRKFYSSVSTAILPRFLERIGSRRLRNVQEIRVLAPFMGAKDNADPEDGAEEGLLNYLREYCPYAKLRVYLPLVGTEKPYKLLCSSSLLKWMRQESSNLVVYGVIEEDRKLHGKILAIRVLSKRDKGYILVGSPNMTTAALISPKGNIETAWGVRTWWDKVESLFSTVPSIHIADLNKVRNMSPKFLSGKSWPALQNASYDVVKRELSITWSTAKTHIGDKYSEHNTELRYARKPVKLNGKTTISPFILNEDICWIETHPKHAESKDYMPGRIPICISGMEWLGLHQDPGVPTPEGLLRMLGAMPKEKGGRTGGGMPGAASGVDGSNYFELSARVRDLCERISFARDWLAEECWSDAEWKRRVKFLGEIFCSHTPEAKNIDQNEKIWRIWVRFEFWRLVKDVSHSTVISSTKKRAFLRKTARRWRRGLTGTTKIPRLRELINLAYRV